MPLSLTRGRRRPQIRAHGRGVVRLPAQPWGVILWRGGQSGWAYQRPILSDMLCLDSATLLLQGFAGCRAVTPNSELRHRSYCISQASCRGQDRI